MNDSYISWFRGCFLTKNTNVEVVCVRVSVTSRSFSTLFLQKKELEGGVVTVVVKCGNQQVNSEF